MICEECHEREATRSIGISINGRTEYRNICDVCATKYFPQSPFSSGLGILESLFGDLPFGYSIVPQERSVRSDCPSVCSVCGTTAEEFSRTGFVGCPHCYEVFEPLIVQSVRKIQRGDRHIGTAPHDDGAEEARLRARIREALDSGDFSAARTLTDRLQELSRKKEDK